MKTFDEPTLTTTGTIKMRKETINQELLSCLTAL